MREVARRLYATPATVYRWWDASSSKESAGCSLPRGGARPGGWTPVHVPACRRWGRGPRWHLSIVDNYA